MIDLEKARRRTALVMAAIKGDQELTKCAAGFSLLDPAEIAAAKAEAAEHLAFARARFNKMNPTWQANLAKLEERIRKIEVADKNYRTPPATRRPASIDVEQAGVFAGLRKRDRRDADINAAVIDATIRHNTY